MEFPASFMHGVPQAEVPPPLASAASTEANPLLDLNRADTMEALQNDCLYRASAFLEASRAPLRCSVDWKKPPAGPAAAAPAKAEDFDRAVSGVAIHELFGLTNDPKMHRRLVAADSDRDGRISRRDIIRVLQSEVAGECDPRTSARPRLHAALPQPLPCLHLGPPPAHILAAALRCGCCALDVSAARALPPVAEQAHTPPCPQISPPPAPLGPRHPAPLPLLLQPT